MSCEGDTKLVSQRSGGFADRLRSKLRTENCLNNAAPIPQVDKKHLTVIPERIHPAGELYLAPDICKRDAAAVHPFPVGHAIKQTLFRICLFGSHVELGQYRKVPFPCQDKRLNASCPMTEDSVKKQLTDIFLYSSIPESKYPELN